jgi:protein TonB
MVTISLIANCQDTVYFDKNQNRIDKHSASSFQIKRDDPSFPGRFIVETFYVNGSRKEIRYYTDRTEKIQIGVSQKWHTNGQLKSKQKYEYGLLCDTLFTFWENGQLKRQDIYQNGKFVKGNCYNNSGKKIPHFDYEEMPKYPGGDNQLFMDISSSLTMPEIVKTKQLKTKVIARFALILMVM